MSEQLIKSIPTPQGEITIEHSSDANYPGCYISINGVTLVLVEYDNTFGTHAIRVWPHEDPDNDYEYLQRIPNPL